MKANTTLESITLSKSERRILTRLLFILEGRSVNNTFTVDINLSNTLVHYLPYNVASNIVVTASNYIIGGGALIRMIADGSHTPDFTAFKKMSGSADWTITNNAINVVTFGYDGVDLWYAINNEAS